MHSPLDVDRAQTLRMLTAFDRTWPAAEIRWPHSSTLLLEALEDALNNQQNLNLRHRSAAGFLKDGRRFMVQAEQRRARAANRLSGLVRRCSFLDDDALATVIERFLVLANYKAHWILQWTLNDARRIGLEFKAPESWEVFSDDEYRVLYDIDRSRAWQGQLVSIAGHPVIGDFGPGLWVYGPHYVFRHRRTLELPCYGLIAQIECESPDDSELPPTYDGEWHIACYRPNGGSGTGLDDVDERAKTDPEIEAELEHLRAERKAEGKDRSTW
jgi:hypothetical protein